MNKMFFVPRPFPGESPTSLLMRTAQGNGYLSVAAMSRNIPVKEHLHWLGMRTHQHAIFELLCQNAPPLANLLRETFYQQPQRKISTTAKVYVNNRAVPANTFRADFCPCPQCLSEGYTRPAQDLKIIDICPYHNTPLMMVCPQCNAHNKWYKINGFQCRCGFDFLSAHTLPPQPHLQFTPDTSFGPLSAIHKLNSMYKIDQLRSTIFPNQPETDEHNKLVKAQIKKTLTRELNTFKNLPLQVFEAPWRQLKNQYYKEFAIKFLRQNHQSENKCTRDDDSFCCRHIDLSFNELKSIFNSRKTSRAFTHIESIESLRDARTNIIYYHAYNLCSILNCELAKRQYNTNNTDPAHYSTLRQAAIRLHTNTTALSELVKAGIISDVIIGERAYFIPNDVINKFSQKYIFASELGQHFCASTKTINLLAKKMKLKYEFPIVTEFSPAIYLRSSISKKVIKSMHQALIPSSQSARSSAHLLKEISSQIDLNIRTAKFVLAHHCNCQNPNEFISQPEKTKLIAWRKLHLTIKDICALTKTNRLLINIRFIHTKLIKPHKICTTNFITTQDRDYIVNHLKKYLSILEAAKLFSTSESKLRKLVKSGKLKTFTIFSDGGHRQILIARTYKNSEIISQL